ncbi:MAG: HAD-IA family hydrolase [Mycolicibacterium sp.]|nr:HAD-IA family hydrolase [Mycolicibacterium sp.]
MTVTIDARFHDAVLFDLDGVLTDTASVHARAWTELFDRFLTTRPARPGENHSPFTAEDYRTLVDGKPREHGIADFLQARHISLPVGRSTDTGGDTIWGLAASKQHSFERLLATGLTVFESTVALVRQLADSGFGVALFSSSRNCRQVLHAAGLDDLFAVCVDGVVAEVLGLPGKPDPAVLLEAAHRLAARPDRCVVVDDGQSGVAAGRAGGFAMVIGVARVDRAEDELLAAGADVVVRDLAEVTITNR